MLQTGVMCQCCKQQKQWDGICGDLELCWEGQGGLGKQNENINYARHRSPIAPYWRPVSRTPPWAPPCPRSPPPCLLRPAPSGGSRARADRHASPQAAWGEGLVLVGEEIRKPHTCVSASRLRWRAACRCREVECPLRNLTVPLVAVYTPSARGSNPIAPPHPPEHGVVRRATPATAQYGGAHCNEPHLRRPQQPGARCIHLRTRSP